MIKTNTLETQISNLGRPFKMVGTEIMLKRTIHTFKFIDKQNDYFTIETDVNNKAINSTFKALKT